jgi:hypothetical protein
VTIAEESLDIGEFIRYAVPAWKPQTWICSKSESFGTFMNFETTLLWEKTSLYLVPDERLPSSFGSPSENSKSLKSMKSQWHIASCFE